MSFYEGLRDNHEFHAVGFLRQVTKESPDPTLADFKTLGHMLSMCPSAILGLVDSDQVVEEPRVIWYRMTSNGKLIFENLQDKQWLLEDGAEIQWTADLR